MRTLSLRSFHPLPLLVAGLLLGAVTLTACDSGGGTPAGEGSVSVGFQTSSTASTNAKATGDSLVIAGSNGTITLDDVRLIVSGIELEGEDDGDDSEESEYESDPSALDLPLGTADVEVVATDNLPAGTYSTFEFEVEDIDFEDGDDDPEEERQQLESLLQELRADYPDWPVGASMVATGTFTDGNGTRTPFTTYFDAEIEVERTLNPPLDVTGDGPGRALTVRLDPAAWFTQTDGTVLNLAENNWSDTQQLVELEAEFENGVAEIETGDDDDDDDDDDDSDD